MIDIIIPMKDNKINLEKTLMSIYLQEIDIPYSVIIIDKTSNEEIINRFKNFFPIKYIKTQENNIKKIIKEKTTAPYIILIDSNSLFYNVGSLITLYETCLQENNNIQGKIKTNDNNLIYELNGIIYIRELLNNNLLQIDKQVCIKQ